MGSSHVSAALTMSPAALAIVSKLSDESFCVNKMMLSENCANMIPFVSSLLVSNSSS